MEPVKVTDKTQDDKYVTFKRSEFYELMGELMLPPWPDTKGNLIGGDIDCAALSEQIVARTMEVEIADAVVIRRQDLFASTAFATYAASISMVGSALDRKGLLQIADYFQRQSELAADEGFKFPDV